MEMLWAGGGGDPTGELVWLVLWFYFRAAKLSNVSPSLGLMSLFVSLCFSFLAHIPHPLSSPPPPISPPPLPHRPHNLHAERKGVWVAGVVKMSRTCPWLCVACSLCADISGWHVVRDTSRIVSAANSLQITSPAHNCDRWFVEYTSNHAPPQEGTMDSRQVRDFHGFISI